MKAISLAVFFLSCVTWARAQATIQQTTASQNWSWNTTAMSSSGVPQNSPLLNLGSKYWNGSADSVDTWSIQNVCGTAASNPACNLIFSHSGSAGGGGIQSTAFVSTGSNPLISLSAGTAPSSLPATSISLFPPSTIGSSYAFQLPAAPTLGAGPLLVSGNPSGSPLTATLSFGTLSNASSTNLQTASGTLTSGNLSSWNSNGDLIDSSIHGASGFIQSNNTVRLTGSGIAVGPSTTTLTSILSWTLPTTASAATYSFSCTLIWESTGAGGAALKTGVGISAAATSIEAGADATYASGAGGRLSTIGYITTTSTGAQQVTSGGTVGAGSTAYTAYMFGTIEGASAAGSTFTIYAAPATSGANLQITIERGSFCQLF